MRKYSWKWIEQNMGITRDMVKYYEEKGLVDGRKRTDLQYRDYDESDLEKIWCIKLLIDIGFSTGEIYKLIYRSDFNFYEALESKITNLEHELAKLTVSVNFAKTIKVTGKFPNVKRMGTMKFGEFIKMARESWNLYEDRGLASLTQVAEMCANDKKVELNTEDLEEMEALLENMQKDMHIYELHSYCKIISSMQDLEYDNVAVQRVVALLCDDIATYNNEGNSENKIEPQTIAKHLISFFVEGDTSSLLAQNYSREGCLFIAKTLEHYGNSNFIK